MLSVREIRSFEGCEGLIGELSGHPLYFDPHFKHDPDNLYRSTEKKDERAFAVSDSGKIEGLFVWLILPEERFLEMMIGFTKKEEAFIKMLSYLETNYPDYQMDFVFNPRNPAILGPLKAKGAFFYKEQQKMLQRGTAPDISAGHVELYSSKREEQYRAIHHTDTYWTADRILSAQNRFRVLLAVENGRVRGYLDVTRCCKENEIYDLFVKPEAEGNGYELELLSKALELNGRHPLMVLVDVDAEKEIETYAGAGFEVQKGYNSVLATCKPTPKDV
ncbi:MAG: GNAT family N-acetyltransferase [Clostridia bacterium]|nr:GNAT family N-acetyltransferase [Clostridia bacterium]